jgi:hypothetical protein
MDPAAAAAAAAQQQPTVWLEGFLTQYGPAMQAFGFLGWLILGVAFVALAVGFCILVPSLRRAALEYARYVESQIGPRPDTDEGPSMASSDEDDTDVDKFVE